MLNLVLSPKFLVRKQYSCLTVNCIEKQLTCPVKMQLFLKPYLNIFFQIM